MAITNNCALRRSCPSIEQAEVLPEQKPDRRTAAEGGAQGWLWSATASPTLRRWSGRCCIAMGPAPTSPSNPLTSRWSRGLARTARAPAQQGGHAQHPLESLRVRVQRLCVPVAAGARIPLSALSPEMIASAAIPQLGVGQANAPLCGSLALTQRDAGPIPPPSAFRSLNLDPFSCGAHLVGAMCLACSSGRQSSDFQRRKLYSH